MRILNLAAKRLVLITEVREVVHKWAHNLDDRPKSIRQAEAIISELLLNQDVVHNVLEALEESKPDLLTFEHNSLVEAIQKSFRWALNEYNAVMEYAREVKFEPQVLEELHKEQSPKN